jgi:hypothetical protein
LAEDRVTDAQKKSPAPEYQSGGKNQLQNAVGPLAYRAGLQHHYCHHKSKRNAASNGGVRKAASHLRHVDEYRTGDCHSNYSFQVASKEKGFFAVFLILRNSFQVWIIIKHQIPIS